MTNATTDAAVLLSTRVTSGEPTSADRWLRDAYYHVLGLHHLATPRESERCPNPEVRHG